MRTVIKLLIGLLLLAIILMRLDMGAVVKAIGDYHAPSVTAAAAIFLVGCFVATAKWRVFIPQFGFLPLLRISLIGQFYAMVLPGQVAGDVVKAYRIAKGQAEKTRLVTSILVDRVVSTLALLVLGAVGLWLSPRIAGTTLGLSFLALILVLCGTLVALRVGSAYVLAGRIAGLIRRIGPRCARLATALERFLEVWRDYASEPARLLISFLIGLVFQLLVVAIYAILANDLSIRITLADWLWITAVASLAVVLPVSIAGIGLREGALIGTLGYLGVAAERAIALSFGIFLLMVFGAMIGWLVEMTDQPAARRDD
jgi:uncharacterized protein (TIRG00374 family)